MSVSAPATSPPVQDSAVATRKPRARQRSRTRRACRRRSAAVAPRFILRRPRQTDGSRRPRDNAFAAAGKAHLLAGGGFDGDTIGGNAGNLGNACAHGVAMRRNPWRLADHSYVEIGDDAFAGAHALAGEGEKAIGRG